MLSTWTWVLLVSSESDLIGFDCWSLEIVTSLSHGHSWLQTTAKRKLWVLTTCFMCHLTQSEVVREMGKYWHQSMFHCVPSLTYLPGSPNFLIEFKCSWRQQFEWWYWMMLTSTFVRTTRGYTWQCVMFTVQCHASQPFFFFLRQCLIFILHPELVSLTHPS